MRIEGLQTRRNESERIDYSVEPPLEEAHRACHVPEKPSQPELSAMKSYGGQNYYGIPSSGQSYYEWRTSTAFLFNGLGGGCQILATFVDLFGDENDRPLVRAGRFMAASGGTLSTLSLINSLHNWRRFYNMLRIFKKTSPMSIGIWAIGPFTFLSGIAAAGHLLEDIGYKKAGRFVGRIFSVPASVLAPLMISYMGTELEETNLPVWACAHPLMSPLYAASGLSNSSAAMLAASEATGASEKIKAGLNKFSALAGAVELALAVIIDRRWRALPEASGFERSAHSEIFRFGYMALGLGAPLLLHIFSNAGADSREIPIVRSILKIGGGWLMQISMVYGGMESGRHATDYFEFTRPGRLNGSGNSSKLPRGSEGEAVGQLQEIGRKKEHSTRKTSSTAIFGLGLFALGAGIMAWSSLKRGKK